MDEQPPDKHWRLPASWRGFIEGLSGLPAASSGGHERGCAHALVAAGGVHSMQRESWDAAFPRSRAGPH